VKGAETRLTLREGKETRRRVGFMPPCLRCHGEEGKRGGVWAPRRLVFDDPGKRGNEAACGLHAASSSMPQERGETRRCVDSTLPRLQRRRNEAACGLHAALSSMPQERGETRQHMDSTPPRLQRRRKEWKRGGVWTPHRLVFDATGRINEAACGFHAVSLSMLQEGGKTTKKQRGGVWVSRDLAGF
jgi:hypothetical protein